MELVEFDKRAALALTQKKGNENMTFDAAWAKVQAARDAPAPAKKDPKAKAEPLPPKGLVESAIKPCFA